MPRERDWRIVQGDGFWPVPSYRSNFAIRQGPIIFNNLRAVLEGGPLAEYEPQRRFLYILNLGDGTGLATYGPFVWRGRLSWKLKHYIDTKFLEKYRR